MGLALTALATSMPRAASRASREKPIMSWPNPKPDTAPPRLARCPPKRTTRQSSSRHDSHFTHTAHCAQAVRRRRRAPETSPPSQSRSSRTQARKISDGAPRLPRRRRARAPSPPPRLDLPSTERYFSFRSSPSDPVENATVAELKP
jgi:hypothetical protein